MALITIRDTKETLEDPQEISKFLEQFGIWFRRFEGSDNLGPDATNEEILEAYQEPIQKLMKEGGYVTADVINITSEVPGLQDMLNKFNREHWHSEDEVRFIVHGRGLFHINPENGPIFSIEVVKGDMINVPEGTHHWFDLCEDRTIRAIRLFQEKAGWTPHYTQSEAEQIHMPLCFGPAFIPPAV
ncbi:MAG: cupin domain-containing protein [Deltaproteobacteria bacterium]|nr:MAG: cupin domain-containing protein [Deltaproteobacteria bacterium]